MYSHLVSIFGFIMLLTCTGCTDLTQYRINYAPCEYTTADSCKDAAIEEHKSDNYTFGFVEFDDQGALWDRKQLDSVIGRIGQEGQKPNGLLLVVFIHGWKNNADFENAKVIGFREYMRRLALLEKKASTTQLPERAVMGLYVGWRGLSVDDYLIKQLTFWDRKNTADKVGHGALTELLIQVENSTNRAKNNNVNTDLVVMGHSLGGLVLYSALSQIMIERMTLPENSHQGFGGLVVMLNAAVEAARFTPLQQMAAAQVYNEGHFPTLIVLTSKGDWATKHMFTIGRTVSTLFETYRPDKPTQRKENITAVGHYQPYSTHELIPLSEENAGNGMSVWDTEFYWEEYTKKESYVVNFDGAANPSDNIQLIHKPYQKSAPQNPIMVVSVDEGVMRDHHDIFNDILCSFLSELIMSKTQN